MTRIPLDMADSGPIGTYDEPDEAGPCQCCGEFTTSRVCLGLDDGVFCCLRDMCKQWCFALINSGGE